MTFFTYGSVLICFILFVSCKVTFIIVIIIIEVITIVRSEPMRKDTISCIFLLQNSVSYTPPWILVESSSSPHFIHKVHLQSTISPPPVLLQSPPVQSTPHGLLMESTWSGLEFNGDVDFMIRVTIYGKSGKHTSVIHLREPFF